MRSLLVAFLLVHLACRTETENSTQADVTAADIAYDAIIAEGKASRSAAVRNFREIDLSLSMLTGIDPRAVRSDYQVVSSMLPLDNSLSSFNGQMQVGVFRLAGAYCDQLINKNTTARTAVLPGIDFSSPPAVALAPAVRAEVAEIFIDAFWRRAASVAIAQKDTVANIETFIAESLGESKGSTRYVDADDPPLQSTSKVLFGICNAMLASAPVIFH